MQIVVMPDVEQLLADYLKSQISVFVANGAAIKVGTRLENVTGQPNNRPVESVVLYRTGGTAGTIVSDKPTVTVDVRAPLESRAQFVAAVCHALLLAAGRDGVVLGGHQVYGVAEFSGPGNLPDPVTAVPRYTFTVQVHIAGTVVDS